MTAERVLKRCCQAYREIPKEFSIHNRQPFDSLAMFDAAMLVWLHGTSLQSLDFQGYGDKQ